MRTHITIADTKLTVEFEIKITCHGSPQSGPSYASGGEPADPAEFDLAVLALYQSNKELELPAWLRELLENHLCERDDINELAQEMDYQEPDYD